MITHLCKQCGRIFTDDDINPNIICKFCEHWNKLPIGGFVQLATSEYIQKEEKYVSRSS